MAEENSLKRKNNFSIDWLLRGTLTKFGETFDRLTGRNWQPSSSLATSELIERLKILLDREARDLGARGKFVPHNIKLKMQWDKFSADQQNSLQKLEGELLTAAVDHINDNRYHTYAPLRLEIKQDYFTDGVKLHANFDDNGETESDAELNVTLPEFDKNQIAQALPRSEKTENVTARFYLNGAAQLVQLQVLRGRNLSVGRSRENDLVIDDVSISKIHASLILSFENLLQVADTGSTNGTFVNGQRIPYGKSFTVTKDDKISFGTVDVFFEYVPAISEPDESEQSQPNDSVKIGDFEFKSKASIGDIARTRNLIDKDSADNDQNGENK